MVFTAYRENGRTQTMTCYVLLGRSSGSLPVALLAADVLMSRQMRFSFCGPVALISMVPLANFAGMRDDSCTSTPTLTAPFATGHFSPSHVIVPMPKGNLMTFSEQTSPL